MPWKVSQLVNERMKLMMRLLQAYRRCRVVDHKKELELINRMRALRDQGFSYWKIADVFNSMKIPTKARRGKWHARTIQKIMDGKK